MAGGEPYQSPDKFHAVAAAHPHILTIPEYRHPFPPSSVSIGAPWRDPNLRGVPSRFSSDTTGLGPWRHPTQLLCTPRGATGGRTDNDHPQFRDRVGCFWVNSGFPSRYPTQTIIQIASNQFTTIRPVHFSWGVDPQPAQRQSIAREIQLAAQCLQRSSTR